MNNIDERLPRLNADEPRVIRSTGLKPGRTVLGDMPPLKTRRTVRVERAYPTERQRVRTRPPAGYEARGRSAARARYRSAERQEEAPPRTFMRDQAGKLVICAGIALAVLLFKSVDTPVTNTITDGLYSAVNADVKLDGDIGRLKFVQDLFPEAAQLVFWQPPVSAPFSLTAPCDGEVSVPYDKEQGMLAYSCLSDVVTAAADGTVSRVDRDANGFLRVTLTHEGGLETRYGHLETVFVKEGERLAAGTRLALMSSEADVPVLRFAAVQDGEPIDPTLLIGR